MARCAYGRAHGDRNGDTSAPLGVGPPSAFCDYDASVDATLGDLHRLLQAGARGVQWQIDQYIVSSSSQVLNGFSKRYTARHALAHFGRPCIA